MVDPGPLRPPRLVVEALGIGEILSKLADILAAYSRTVCYDRTSLTPEVRSGRVIHSFLEELASEVDLVPGLERVTMVGLDPDERVLLMHLIFSFRVSFYSTQRHIFACLVKIPAKGLPPVVDIPHGDFSARRSVRTVPRVDHITHLEGISLLYWHMNPCKRAAKSAGK